jgi:8-oxo-dGTP pyrophosphatase MutT (NUDIX family)
MNDIPIIPLSRLDLRYESAPWPFASERRTEIDAHFAKLRIENPELWNGKVLLLRRGQITDGTLGGAYSEVDFASFIAWRDWGFPDASVRNCFAMAALRSADRAFLLGVMGRHTATAGQIYFAAGTPDPKDIIGETVDLEHSVMRELFEETGLRRDAVVPELGWSALPFGQRLPLMKIVQAHEGAEPLRARIRKFLATQPQPELADIHIVRSMDDLRPNMPPYVAAFLRARVP